MNRNRNIKYNPQIHHRRSIRLPDYDYATGGAYFITICTYQKQLLFNGYRIKHIVDDSWRATGKIRDDVIIDDFVVMPNHVHGIIVISHPLAIQTEVVKRQATPPLGVFDTPGEGDAYDFHISMRRN